MNESDPKKPIRNRKHELFARELAKKPTDSQDKAYLKVYPLAEPQTAIVNASKLLSKTNVRDRVLELMSREKPILEKVSDKVNQHIDGDNAPVSMDACKTVLKIAGALDEQKLAESSYNPVQINIIIEGKRETKDSNSNDVIEIQP